MSVHEVRSGLKWHGQTCPGCKESSVYGRTLGTSAKCSDVLPRQEDPHGRARGRDAYSGRRASAPGASEVCPGTGRHARCPRSRAGHLQGLLPMGLAAQRYFAQRGTGAVGPAVTRADGISCHGSSSYEDGTTSRASARSRWPGRATARLGSRGASRWTRRSTSPSGATRTAGRSGWPYSRSSSPSRTVQACSRRSLPSIWPRAS